MKSNKATQNAIKRIAELKIKTHSLPDTIEEYIRKCTRK